MYHSMLGFDNLLDQCFARENGSKKTKLSLCYPKKVKNNNNLILTRFGELRVNIQLIKLTETRLDSQSVHRDTSVCLLPKPPTN